MKKPTCASIMLVVGTSVLGVTGCEQMEQAANDAVLKAKQAAVQVLDEARQAGSIDEVKQSAERAAREAKQNAAGLLKQAGDDLAKDEQVQQRDGLSPGIRPPRSNQKDS